MSLKVPEYELTSEPQGRYQRILKHVGLEIKSVEGFSEGAYSHVSVEPNGESECLIAPDTFHIIMQHKLLVSLEDQQRLAEYLAALASELGEKLNSGLVIFDLRGTKGPEGEHQWLQVTRIREVFGGAHPDIYFVADGEGLGLEGYRNILRFLDANTKSYPGEIGIFQLIGGEDNVAISSGSAKIDMGMDENTAAIPHYLSKHQAEA